MIKKLYGMEAIKLATLQAISSDAITLSFVATLFQIDKTDLKTKKPKHKTAFGF